ncbi:hypothetical protein GCM10023339_60410 [Alloalcanivorax gelatiniphagus]
MADFLERAQAAVGDDGRLPLGRMPDWDVFPFERDGLRARPLTEFSDPEPDRRQDPADCRTCRALGEEAQVLHTGARLAVIRPGATSLPFVANVVAREHELIEDLDDAAHAELGRLLARTCAAVRALDGVGNAHITKWENGSGHLSVNVMARPRGVLQLRGSNLPVWADMLPDIPQDEYDARAEAVRSALS